MKTNTENKLPADFGNEAARGFSIQNSKFKIQNCAAFTLIELLTVISIIAILAAFTIPILHSLKRREYISKTQAELSQLETAIDNYKTTYGFYPPDNPGNPLVNQLYFELLGTTNVGTSSAPDYQSLDDPSLQPLLPSQLNTAFSSAVNGFMNCSRPGSSEDVPAAKNFLPGLKPDQIVIFTNNGVPLKLIVASVGGPDVTYHPLGAGAIGINPWRYNSSSPTNDPGSYDLWVQLVIGGQTNLVCNWSKQVQINSPLP